MEITVTKKHIRNGRRFDKNHCPIAMAIKDASCDLVEDVDGINVTVGFITYELPKIAQAFVVMFDGGQRVRPFSFKLPL